MSQKICVYAICKNELKFVDQWLENMSEADYIVVLDTGSTDGTYEKLKEDPRVTRVEQEVITPWRFDVARNRSMDLIPDDADILVCTDFDELFEPGWAQYLRDNWVPGYHTRCHYTYAWAHGEKGEPQFVFTYDKIHTRDYQWVFPVHEVLARTDGLSSEEDCCLEAGEQIYLHHWQDQTKPRGSYLGLLELSVQENPKLSHIHLLYAREYMILKDWDKAIELLLKVLEVEDVEYADKGLVLLQTLDYLSLAYYEIGDKAASKWYCEEFIRVNPTYREPYFRLATIFNEERLFTLAEYTIQAGLKYSTYKSNWVESASAWYLDDKVVLGSVYLNLDNFEKAAENLKQALEYRPNDLNLLKQYIVALENLNK